jgi:hypothetical protein
MVDMMDDEDRVGVPTGMPEVPVWEEGNADHVLGQFSRPQVSDFPPHPGLDADELREQAECMLCGAVPPTDAQLAEMVS